MSPETKTHTLTVDDSYREFCSKRVMITAEAYTKGKMEVVDLVEDFPLLDKYCGRLVGAGRFMVIHTSPLESIYDDVIIKSYIKGIVERAGDDEISWKVMGLDKTTKHEKLLIQTGFIKEEESEVMYLDLSEQHPMVQSNLVVKHVKDRAGLEDFAGIHKERNSSVGSYFLAFDIDSRPVREEQVRFYVGYDNGLPVTCTQIIISSKGNIGIQSLATHPAHQKKGHASFLLSHIIAELSSAKLRYVFLGATCPSVDIYKRLGFRHHGHFTSFVRKP